MSQPFTYPAPERPTDEPYRPKHGEIFQVVVDPDSQSEWVAAERAVLAADPGDGHPLRPYFTDSDKILWVRIRTGTLDGLSDLRASKIRFERVES